ncbi:MAG: ATP phosphoribosyltransferase regulatory subunit [Thermodesulfobacteriota bacterium]
MNGYSILPQGVKDFGPEKAEDLRRVEDGLLEEFSRWGYKRVITPLFEYVDSICVGLGNDLKNKLMKFVDPSTGEIVALRPDITPQIGRIVATQLKDYNYPLRLCYCGRVVRFEEKGSGKEREVFQSGCELIGLKSEEADAEIVALSIKSLNKLGLKNLILDLGHTGILKLIFENAGEMKNDLIIALKKKDQEQLKNIIGKTKIDKEIKKVVLSLSEYYGDQSVLEKAKKIRQFRPYVNEIEKIISILEEYQVDCKISIDLVDIKGFNYYTGINFEIISENAPSSLLTGGRYDGLVAAYGYDTPATGFAIDAEAILALTRNHIEDNQVHFIVIPKTLKYRKEAIKLTEWLRSSGFKVILDLNKSFANGVATNGSRSLTSYGVIILESSSKINLIESRSGVRREFSNLEELLKGGI